MKLRSWLGGLTLILCWAIILGLGAGMYQRMIQTPSSSSLAKEDSLLHYDLQAVIDNSFQCSGSMEVDKIISYDALSRWCLDAMTPYLKSLTIEPSSNGITLHCYLPDDLSVLASWLTPTTLTALEQVRSLPIVIEASPAWNDGELKLHVQRISVSFYDLPSDLYQEAIDRLEQQIQTRLQRVDPCVVSAFMWQDDGLAVKGTFPHTIR